jgi:phosphatidylglycerol:prolipoprotein diacylglycerol transferase
VRVQPTPIYETVTMCLLAYALWQLRDRVRPGVVFALYLIGSGLERFLVEFIRRNKEVLVGLTGPQVESLVLLAIGLVWLGPMVQRGGVAGLRPAAA